MPVAKHFPVQLPQWFNQLHHWRCVHARTFTRQYWSVRVLQERCQCQTNHGEFNVSTRVVGGAGPRPVRQTEENQRTASQVRQCVA